MRTNTTDGERALRAVLAALGEVEGVDPVELEYSLYEWIEPGALAALYTASPGLPHIIFEVDAHEATLAADGRVTIDETTYQLDELLDR